MPTRARTVQVMQAALERREKVAALRRSGVRGQKEIARRLGCAVATVNRDMKVLNKELAERAREDHAHVIALDLDRLDEMLQSLWPVALKGSNFKAIEMVLRIIERRSKLLGLDAPEKRELSGPQGGPLSVSHGLEESSSPYSLEARQDRILRLIREAEERGLDTGSIRTIHPIAPDNGHALDFKQEH